MSARRPDQKPSRFPAPASPAARAAAGLADTVDAGGLRPPMVVAGHRLEAQLGEGGFGTVFAATDLALLRPVALKTLHRLDAAQLDRFRDEARLLARINDPHVVQIYQVGALPDGAPFLTMERFGEPLRAVLRRGRPVDAELAVSVIAQVLRALVAAHGQGVVHRDIKESNILYDADSGITKLCDFGIARAVDPLPDAAMATGTHVIGTPHYLAPERLLGVRKDPRSDLFAVGVVLYRMLTGRRPYEAPGGRGGAPGQLATPHPADAQRSAPPPPEHGSRALSRLCMRLIALDPELRPPSAYDALVELLRAHRAEPTGSLATPQAIAAEPAGVPHLIATRARPTARGFWPAAVAAGVGLAALLAAGAYRWWGQPEGSGHAPSPISAGRARVADAATPPRPEADGGEGVGPLASDRAGAPDGGGSGHRPTNTAADGAPDAVGPATQPSPRPRSGEGPAAPSVAPRPAAPVDAIRGGARGAARVGREATRPPPEPSRTPTNPSSRTDPFVVPSPGGPSH